jgi:hypothetical protein
MSDTGNYIADFLRGRAMALDENYAEEVYRQRRAEQFRAAKSALEKSLVVPSDAPRLSAIMETGDPRLMADYVRDTFPSKNDFRIIHGTGGQTYSFDANRDTYRELPGIIDPRYDIPLQGRLASERARANAMNRRYHVRGQDGSEAYLSGAEIEQMQNGSAPPQPEPVELPEFALDIDGVPENQRVITDSIVQQMQSGQIPFDTGMEALTKLGAKLLPTDSAPAPAPAPAPVPIDSGNGLQRPMQPPPQPNVDDGRQFPFGQTTQDKTQQYADKKSIDIAAKQRENEVKLEKAREKLRSQIDDIEKLYITLDSLNGMPNYKKDTLSNLGARFSASPLGQLGAEYTGSRQNAVRQSILQQLPMLMQYLVQSSGMSGKQIDSEKEMEFFRKAATEPSQDINAVLHRLKELRVSYLGEKPDSRVEKDFSQDKSGEDMDMEANDILKRHGIK